MKLIYYTHGDRSENKIALTFDDGPNPYFTETVLNILKKHNVKATFFILGKWAIIYPEIVKRIFLEGHLIGNHSYSHIRGDFIGAGKIIKEIIGQFPVYTRPPYSNLEFCFALNPKDLRNMKIINYDVDSLDYSNFSSKEIILRIKKQVQNGSIIDFHDGSENREEAKERPLQMLKALPILIRILKKKYLLVRIDELSLIPRVKFIDKKKKI